MKKISFSLAFIAPLAVTGVLFSTLYTAAQHGLMSGMYSQDVCEAHNVCALLPLITVISILFGFIPAMCFTSRLLVPAIITEEQGAAEEIADQVAPPLEVGQIITSAAHNCILRVKAVKSIFATADLSQYEYILNASF